MGEQKQERWLPIQGWPYEISSLGRIRRTSAQCGTRIGRILKPNPKQRYLTVTLRRDGDKKCIHVHALVAEYFLGPRPKGCEVNHRGAGKHDNSESNLEYLTGVENRNHAMETGLVALGERNSHSKITENQVREIRELGKSGLPRRQIERRFGLGKSAIGHILRRETWRRLED